MKTQEEIVEQAIASLRPMISRDGGDIKLEKIEDGVVYVSLHGACVGCPASIYTLKLGIEHAIKEQLPEIKEIVPL